MPCGWGYALHSVTNNNTSQLKYSVWTTIKKLQSKLSEKVKMHKERERDRKKYLKKTNGFKIKPF